MAVPLIPPGAGSNDKAVLKALYDAVAELQQPKAPPSDFTIDTAANLLAKAPAASFRGARAIVTDAQCLAVSVETSPGAWAWLRADGSAL